MLQDLIKHSQPSEADLAEKRKVTAKMLADNKARAAALLLPTFKKLEASTPSVSSTPRTFLL